MKNGLLLFALFCAPALFTLGCSGGGNEVVPVPVSTTDESAVPEGTTEAEYAKAMADSMKQ